MQKRIYEPAKLLTDRVMKRSKRNKFRSNGPSVSLLAQKAKKRFCIAVDEDWGFYLWLWFPPVAANELEEYWSIQRGAEGNAGLKDHLGGEWICNEDFGTSRSTARQFFRLWRRLHVPTRYYAYINDDSDSYLQAPDGRLILHAGCDESFLVDEAPCIEMRYARWKANHVNNARKKMKPQVIK